MSVEQAKGVSAVDRIPAGIEPMLATTGQLPKAGEWAYEFKWDGIRAITYWDGQRIRIKSRNLLDITFRYPELEDLGACLGDNAVLDGEIIALDESNRPNFGVLQKRMHISESKAHRALPPMRIFYYVFDLLFVNGRDMMGEAYEARRGALEHLMIQHKACRVPPSYRGSGESILDIARGHHLEGIICKRIDSVYQAGRRSGDWIKVKLVKSDEFIICGFKYADHPGKRIGSLQLGAYDKDMKLTFTGLVGTGFSQEDHDYLRGLLEPIVVGESPFDSMIGKDVRFTKPLYVVHVEYRRWPRGGVLQQASFKGLRPDKRPGDVRLEGG